jgi:hypothetical protein
MTRDQQIKNIMHALAKLEERFDKNPKAIKTNARIIKKYKSLVKKASDLGYHIQI